MRLGGAPAQAPSTRPLAASISFGRRKILQQLQNSENKDSLLHTQDEARHHTLSGDPGDQLIKKADHASASKRFDHLDDQNDQDKQAKDDGGVISVATPIRSGSYRGFEGNRNDNDESVSNLPSQSNQHNNKSDFPSGVPSPDIFLNAMRPHGTANQ